MMGSPSPYSLSVMFSLTRSSSSLLSGANRGTPLSTRTKKLCDSRSCSGASVWSKDSLSSTMHITGPSGAAITFMLRGLSVSSAPSPKKSPGPRCRTRLPSTSSSYWQFTRPECTMKNSSPSSPCLMIGAPGWYVTFRNASCSCCSCSSLSGLSSGTVRSDVIVCADCSADAFTSTCWYLSRSMAHSLPRCSASTLYGRSDLASNASSPMEAPTSNSSILFPSSSPAANSPASTT
mmetsp:Transcript_1701/g.5065  ORF Transcript_1701/g.5065 Transcript_1701/m.5065 type:complete len:235 (-) Transcript_1701:564-1268(-)